VLVFQKEAIFIIIHIVLFFIFGVLALHQSRIVGSGLVETAFPRAPVAFHKNVTKRVCDDTSFSCENLPFFKWKLELRNVPAPVQDAWKRSSSGWH